MTLGKKQELFFYLMTTLLVPYIYSKGYMIRGGDLFRDKRVNGKFGVKKGYSSSKSMHKLKLAIDLNLTLNGKMLTKTEQHKIFGEYWLSLHNLCRWGGSNGNKDGNHYSMTHYGGW